MNSINTGSSLNKLEVKHFKPEIAATGKTGYLLYALSGLGLYLLYFYALILLTASTGIKTGISGILFLFALFRLTEESPYLIKGAGAREILTILILPSITFEAGLGIPEKGSLFCLAFLYNFPLALKSIYTAFQYFKKLYTDTGQNETTDQPENKDQPENQEK
jgi:phosphatidylglycerophosphate synthase